MTTEIKAPSLPESVPDGTIATWYKQPGESAARDELLVDIETDKVVLEVVAPADGVLKDIQKAEGDTIVSNEVLAMFEEGEISQKSDSANNWKLKCEKLINCPHNFSSRKILNLNFRFFVSEIYGFYEHKH